MCQHDSPAHREVVATTRRSLLKAAAVVGGGLTLAGGLNVAGAPAASAGTGATGDRIVVLGTDGGPIVRASRAKPALALVVNQRTYLVDAGLNTATQLVASGLKFAPLGDVFVTHHHLDHTSGLLDVLLHGWAYHDSRLGDVTLWGPPKMSATTAGLNAAFEQEIRLFVAGGFLPEFPQVRARNVEIRPGSTVVRVMEDANVIVDATRVFHGAEVKDAYAYRFTVKQSGKVVVFSGDTAAPDQNLIELAHGCDYLVHEVQDNDNVEVLTQSMPPAQASALREHLLTSHSNVMDVPKVAKAAEAKNLVFCHYTPIPQPASVYLAKAQSVADKIGYRGTITAPVDLDEIAL
ncbi:MBL fold metallo-hydrolase [Streptomyces sp. NPDC047072]|uniref:MBL fold metallo-hydrolase n=1 Tax=Streptomyces sp. NPDC047072 TaxID=3154809 RepID=UPI0033E424D2